MVRICETHTCQQARRVFGASEPVPLLSHPIPILSLGLAYLVFFLSCQHLAVPTAHDCLPLFCTKIIPEAAAATAAFDAIVVECSN